MEPSLLTDADFCGWWAENSAGSLQVVHPFQYAFKALGWKNCYAGSILKHVRGV